VCHYVKNLNQRHRPDTCPHVIISDLVNQDALASVRHVLGSREGKKEILSFATRLSLFKIGDVPTFVTAFVTKARHTFC
jgi:hypothetical protein